jgi:hypothetical protein
VKMLSGTMRSHSRVRISGCWWKSQERADQKPFWKDSRRSRRSSGTGVTSVSIEQIRSS